MNNTKCTVDVPYGLLPLLPFAMQVMALLTERYPQTVPYEALARALEKPVDEIRMACIKLSNLKLAACGEMGEDSAVATPLTFPIPNDRQLQAYRKIKMRLEDGVTHTTMRDRVERGAIGFCGVDEDCIGLPIELLLCPLDLGYGAL